MLREPADVTSVVDAWDEDGSLDLHFTLGYRHSWKRAAILRETQDPLLSPAGGIARVAVADFAESTSRLNVRADLGLYKDLGLIVRVPVVLSSSATLQARDAPLSALEGAPGEPLFSLPFGSPNRSGVEYLGIGVDWGILNQWRDAAQPSLLVGAEVRLSVSEPMHACGPTPGGAGGEPGARRCAYPSDIDRDGQSGEFPVELGSGRIEPLEGDFPAAGRRAGVSRGTTALELHSLMSRRLEHLEPYMGFSVLFEFANQDSDFAADRPWNEGPPTRAAFSLGTEILPWEVVERFQRFSIDVRATGSYRSAGQDYSELFDALGSSGASSYRRPNFSAYMANPDAATSGLAPSVVDPSSTRVFPIGITEVEAHGAYALRVAARWQAGQYVHFDLGGAVALTQRHLITIGQPCDGTAPSAATAGPCAVGGSEAPGSAGLPDPSFRPETDQPGRRFIVDTARTIDAWVGATVMF